MHVDDAFAGGRNDVRFDDHSAVDNHDVRLQFFQKPPARLAIVRGNDPDQITARQLPVLS